MQQLESDLDVTQEKLLNANQKLEEKEKALLNAEGEVAALNRRIQMLEEDLEKSEERLLIATQKLDQASTAADDNQRMCKVLENKSLSDESRMEALENQLRRPACWPKRPTRSTTSAPRSWQPLRETWTAQRSALTPRSTRSLNSRRS